MKRRGFIGLLATFALPKSAEAQQRGKTATVALFSAGPFAALPAFIEGMRELGWVERKNIVFVSRSAENRLDRLSEVAKELVALDVDVIVTAGTLAPLAAKRATTTIPIVMSPAGDPVGSGLVASLSRPGGNLTGLSLMAPDVGAKRLELLRELSPAMTRVAILWNVANPYPPQVFKATKAAAEMLGVELQSLEVRVPDDFAAALETARKVRAEGLITVEDPLTIDFRKQIAGFASEMNLPAIYGVREFVDAGGLMAYGASLSDLRRRAAAYVDKVLKGANPADLPIQQPTKFELVLNLKSAGAIGLTIPPTLLARADEVIE